MRKRGRGLRWIFFVTLVMPLVVPFVPVVPAGAAYDSAFDSVWSSTDQAVASGQASYGWFWGPEKLLQTVEVYITDHGDEREVRYYDKSRMEINNPNGDPNSIYYVTNGLLASELITGRLQYSDGAFEQRAPATALVAGDPVNNPGTPSYRTFYDHNLATTDGSSNRAPNRTGQPVTDFLHPDGQITSVAADSVFYGSYQEVTGHNIASVFWDWANSTGSGLRPDIGVNWLYVLGYPITEPYWIDSTVAGTTRRVLVQIFERRALTYTPDNPAQYRVEFGNIGQHYYSWRYGSQTGAPGAYDIVFTTTIGLNVDIARVNLDGSGFHNLTNSHTGYDGWPFYSRNGNYIAFKRGGDGDSGTLAIMDRDGSDVDEFDAGITAIHDWSYDSNYVAYQEGGNVWIVHRNGQSDRIKIGDGNHHASFAPNALEVLATDGRNVRRFAPLTGADPVLIATTPDGVQIQDVAWIKGNRFVAILNDADQHCVQVFSVGTSAVQIAPTCTNTLPLRGLRISADQTECVYIATGATSDILRVQKLTGSSRAKDLALVVDGVGELRYTGVDWAYHPTYIVVGATRGNASALYVIAHDGREQYRLTDPSSIAARLPSISPSR